MTRKHKHIGGIIGADPLPSGSPRPGVSNLGELGVDVVSYEIDRSLRFDGSGDYLSRSQGAPTEPEKWTWAGWVKLSTSSTAQQNLLGAGSSGNQGHLQLINNRFGVRKFTSVEDFAAYTSSTYTDTAVWTHFVLAYDSTLGSDYTDDRVKIWVNGQLENTLVNYSGGSASYPDQNETVSLNAQSVSQYISRRAHSAAYYFNGQLAEVHFIDGQALTAADFGETRDGQWVPKEVTGVTYGNNGFHLDFADSSTASALGTDATTNSNDFTVPANTLTPDDQLIDSPNLRFASLDPTSKGTYAILSEGNLKITNNNSSWGSAKTDFAIPAGDKVYFEVMMNGLYGMYGVTKSNSAQNSYLGAQSDGWALYPLTAKNELFHDTDNSTQWGTSSAGGPSNRVFMCAVDRSAGKIYFGAEGNWFTGDETEVSSFANAIAGFTDTDLSSGSLFPAISVNNSSSVAGTLNFGQDHTFAGSKSPLTSPHTDDDGNGEFRYQPPTGFKALATSY